MWLALNVYSSLYMPFLYVQNLLVRKNADHLVRLPLSRTSCFCAAFTFFIILFFKMLLTQNLLFASRTHGNTHSYTSTDSHYYILAYSHSSLAHLGHCWYVRIFSRLGVSLYIYKCVCLYVCSYVCPFVSNCVSLYVSFKRKNVCPCICVRVSSCVFSLYLIVVSVFTLVRNLTTSSRCLIVSVILA